MHWIIDFDDTLAVGPNTWALTRIIPDMVVQYDLTYNADHLNTVSLRAQQLANETNNEEVILREMFQALGWPPELQKELLTRMYQEYIPMLYSDTMPFLESLKATNDIVFIVSNNNRAPQLAETLGISRWVKDILTPERCDNAKAKPHSDMWDFMVSSGLISADIPVTIVGDDPWSEGGFADAAGQPCYIVDRLNRYHSLHREYKYFWCASLLEIQLAG